MLEGRKAVPEPVLQLEGTTEEALCIVGPEQEPNRDCDEGAGQDYLGCRRSHRSIADSRRWWWTRDADECEDVDVGLSRFGTPCHADGIDNGEVGAA